MILLPGKLVYVLTPRTGSRAMERAFLEHVPGAQDIGRHHGFTDYGLPVYATIRRPVDQVLSHWWKVRDRMSLEEYIEQRTPRLNIHHEHIQHYFRYEDGLARVFQWLGYPGVKVAQVGESNPGIELTPAQVELINQKFADDVALYNGLGRWP